VSDYESYHNDMLQLERRIDELLLAAATRPLTESEVLDLRLFAGVPARSSARPQRVICGSEEVPF